MFGPPLILVHPSQVELHLPFVAGFKSAQFEIDGNQPEVSCKPKKSSRYGSRKTSSGVILYDSRSQQSANALY